MGLRHKSTEGFGLEDVRKTVQPADALIDIETDHDEASKIIKVALGGAAVGGLLTGAFMLAHHHLNKKKEQ